jgi:hypothetical protein
LGRGLLREVIIAQARYGSPGVHKSLLLWVDAWYEIARRISTVKTDLIAEVQRPSFGRGILSPMTREVMSGI